MSLLSFHLPTYSPLSLGALWWAAADGISENGHSASALGDLLRLEYNADRAILCGSGAQALQLAIRTAVKLAGGTRRQRRPVVALPAFTCFEVAAAALGAEADVALYDVVPETLAPDLTSFERALRHGVDAAVVSPLFGVPIEWEAVERMAAARGVVLIEDAAQANGGVWRGKRLGSFGRLSVLSFGRGKGWSGIKGGALLMRGNSVDPEVPLESPGAAAELSLAAAGLAQWGLGRPSLYRLPRSIPWLGLGETRYHDPSVPQQMTRVGAALALRSRAPAEGEAEKRRENARIYSEQLPESDLVQKVRVPGSGTAGYLRFPVRLRNGIGGFSVRPTHLGVESAYPHPISELPKLRPHIVNAEDRWPGSAELSERLVTLPTHSRLRPRERQRVIEMVRRYRG